MTDEFEWTEDQVIPATIVLAEDLTADMGSIVVENSLEFLPKDTLIYNGLTCEAYSTNADVHASNTIPVDRAASGTEARPASRGMKCYILPPATDKMTEDTQ